MGRLFTLPPDVARLVAAQRKPKVRRCQHCETEFVTIGRGIFCSAKCKRAMEYRRIRAKRRMPMGGEGA